jgi:VWFA-related protein
MRYKTITMLRVTAVLLLTGWALSPQEPLPSFTVRSDLVYLPTRVETKKGDTIYGLQADAFIVEDNGVRQPVTVDAGPDLRGISLVVVVQCSRSAPEQFDRLKGLPTMIDAIAGGAPRDIAVLGYGEGPHLLGDFSSRSQDTRQALAKLKPCGNYGAATMDAVSYAIGMLNRRKATYRRAVLLISETRDHASKAKPDEVARELGVGDVVIYTVAFAPLRNEFTGAFRNPQAKFTPQYPVPKAQPKSEAASDVETDPEPDEHAPLLQLPPQIMLIVNALRKDASSEIASLSGGEHFSFSSQKSFDESLLKISNRIHNYYLLSFKPKAGSPGLHTLSVRVDTHPDAVIQTRRNYLGTISAGQ